MTVEIEKKRELGNQRLILTREDKNNDPQEDKNTEDGDGNLRKEDFREKMMLENTIKGHLPFIIRRLNGKKIYEYNIDGLSSLEEEAERKLGFEKIRTLAMGFFDIVSAGAPYLLREDDYVVTPQTVFFDKESKELKLVYCPGYGLNLKTALEELMEYCLDTIDYNDDRAVRGSYGLYMKLRDGCSLMQLNETVRTFAEEKGDEHSDVRHETIDRETEYRREAGHTGGRAPANRYEEIVCESANGHGEIEREPVNWHEAKYPDGLPPCLDEKRTPIEWVRDFWSLADKRVKMTMIGCAAGYIILTLAVVSGKLEVLSRSLAGVPLWIPIMIAAAAVCVMMLIRSVRPVVQLLTNPKEKSEESEDNETILMIGSGTQESLVLVSEEMPCLHTDKFPCVIGKDNMSCDLVVEAKGVSRKHLRLDRNRHGGLTVEDLNTINGTFLNGRKLAPNMAFEIREGDEISFGSVSYYVNHLE